MLIAVTSTSVLCVCIDGTIILFLIPWYFSVKYQGIKVIALSVSPLVSGRKIF